MVFSDLHLKKYLEKGNMISSVHSLEICQMSLVEVYLCYTINEEQVLLIAKLLV